MFDNTHSVLTQEKLTDLQWQLWNSHEVPLCFIFQPDKVDILSCWTKPEFFDAKTGQRKYKPNEVIALAADAQEELDKLKRFSGEALENGSFWDNPCNSKLANRKQAAHDSLIDAIEELDEELASKHILPTPLRRKVLVICLMLKYLEDRGVLAAADFKRFRPNATELFQVLASAKSFVRLLDAQAKRFNGDVFKLSAEEQQLLLERDAELGMFASVLDGQSSKKQRFLWKLYSFEYLPVEVISYIYQRFVKGAVGAVYTPPFLVDFLLGEAMPYEKITDNFKVLDPACGSGVFLVGAFKRLVNSWRHGRNWQRARESLLKRRLKALVQQVHGVDQDPFAVELTVFSLSLALCDQLEPKQIRRHFQFDMLKGVTIHESDFFEFLPKVAERNERWQLVIGNPPFETSHLTPAARAVEAKAKSERPSSGGEPIDTPYQQLAFLFLEQSIKLAADKGIVCLLVPSTLLYGINSADFRASILLRWHIPQIVDFTSIRNLFPDGDTKCCAVVIEQRPPSVNESILHITPRRTCATKEGIFFEIDAYDFHRVDYQTALTDNSVWKANLLGGGRTHSIVLRLLEVEKTVGTFVQAGKDRGWISRVGFIEGNTVKQRPAKHLTGHPHLPTGAFTERGIEEDKIIPKLKVTLFKDPANEKQFEPPALLIRLLRSLPVELRTDYLTYRDDIVGIKAPPEELAELKSLHTSLRRLKKIHQFFLFTTGAQILAGKATVPQKFDLDRLPLLTPKEINEPFFSDADMAVVNDVVDYFADFVRLGQKSILLTRPVKDVELNQFTEQYLTLLNQVYHKFRRGPTVQTEAFVCMHFSYGGPARHPLQKNETLDRALQRLLRRPRNGVYVQRILRLYAGNTIYLIKPNRLRYWIRSAAVRDADETVVELATSGTITKAGRRRQP